MTVKCSVCGEALESTGADTSQLPWVHVKTGDAFAGLGAKRHQAQVVVLNQPRGDQS